MKKICGGCGVMADGATSSIVLLRLGEGRRCDETSSEQRSSVLYP